MLKSDRLDKASMMIISQAKLSYIEPMYFYS